MSDDEARLVVVTHELYEGVIDERDRARALAAKLEEVVAMRTLILKAIVRLDRGDQVTLDGIAEWAAAQLSEVP